MIKKTINPFLHFNGNCKEVLEYYRDIFNGNIELLMTAKGKFATEFPSENSIDGLSVAVVIFNFIENSPEVVCANSIGLSSSN
jgi:uncharacterized glyoxalase superfamily protein PhnB